MTSLHIAVEVQLLKPANKFAKALLWGAITFAVDAGRIANNVQKALEEQATLREQLQEWHSRC